MLRSASLALVFAALIAVCAQVAVPMVPVPMTLQTLAVLLAGLVLGPVGGVAAVGLYLLAAAVGLPVLSDGRGGLAALAGPTAGYLVGFVLATGLAGVLARSRLRRDVGAVIAGLIAIHGLILALGAAWLAREAGLDTAIAQGLLPFLPGAVVKSIAAWAIWRLMSVRRQTRFS